jgi:hypothetical protein
MHPVTVSGPTFGQDPAAASWVGERLTDEIGHVTATVPAGFEAYARILHSAGDDGQPISWADVAAAAGTQVHPLVQWHKMTRQRPGKQEWWHELGPEEGNLPADQLDVLLRVLRRHTTTPDDCWFCLWVGYGWIRGSPSAAYIGFHDGGSVTERDVPPAYPQPWLDRALWVRHPDREYLLGRGPLEAALGVGQHVTESWFSAQSPNLFWPDDRRWCVATEIDFDSTLVAGSDALVDDLIRTPLLEAFRVGPGDSLRSNADRIN